MFVPCPNQYFPRRPRIIPHTAANRIHLYAVPLVIQATFQLLPWQVLFEARFGLVRPQPPPPTRTWLDTRPAFWLSSVSHAESCVEAGAFFNLGYIGPREPQDRPHSPFVKY